GDRLELSLLQCLFLARPATIQISTSFPTRRSSDLNLLCRRQWYLWQLGDQSRQPHGKPERGRCFCAFEHHQLPWVSRQLQYQCLDRQITRLKARHLVTAHCANCLQTTALECERFGC